MRFDIKNGNVWIKNVYHLFYQLGLYFRIFSHSLLGTTLVALTAFSTLDNYSVRFYVNVVYNGHCKVDVRVQKCDFCYLVKSHKGRSSLFGKFHYSVYVMF